MHIVLTKEDDGAAVNRDTAVNIVAELHGVVEWPARFKEKEAVVVVWNNPLTEGNDLREVDERRPVEVEHTPANGG